MQVLKRAITDSKIKQFPQGIKKGKFHQNITLYLPSASWKITTFKATSMINLNLIELVHTMWGIAYGRGITGVLHTTSSAALPQFN
jgi:hypothetical protein